MKNAVAFFGLTRALNVTCRNLKENLIKENDLFVHTWKLTNNIENWHKSKEPDISNTFDSFYRANELHNNLVSLKVEQQKVFSPKIHYYNGQKIYFSNQLNMWKSFAASASLVLEKQQSEGDYEVVIFTRSDIYFHRPLPSEFIEKAKTKVIFAGNKNESSYSSEDLIIGMPGSILPKFISLPELYSKYVLFLMDKKAGEVNSVENFLMYALGYFGIDFEYYPFSHGIDFKIIRESSKFWFFVKVKHFLLFWK